MSEWRLVVQWSPSTGARRVFASAGVTTICLSSGCSVAVGSRQRWSQTWKEEEDEEEVVEEPSRKRRRLTQGRC
jgi:hypothetical protein